LAAALNSFSLKLTLVCNFAALVCVLMLRVGFFQKEKEARSEKFQGLLKLFIATEKYAESLKVRSGAAEKVFPLQSAIESSDTLLYIYIPLRIYTAGVEIYFIYKCVYAQYQV